MIDPDDAEDTRELRFVLQPDFQGKGYMTEVIEAVIKNLRNSGIMHIWACCFQDNGSSKKLIEKFGFQLKEESDFITVGDNKTYHLLEYCIDF